jgi:hypothetical protein
MRGRYSDVSEVFHTQKKSECLYRFVFLNTGSIDTFSIWCIGGGKSACTIFPWEAGHITNLHVYKFDMHGHILHIRLF